MTAVQHTFIVAGIVFVMIRFRDVMLHGGTCMFCGGHGDHRDDCPERDD